MDAQIQIILERIRAQGLRYPLQVLPAFGLLQAREIVYDPDDIVAALDRGIAISPVSEVAVQEAFVMD